MPSSVDDNEQQATYKNLTSKTYTNLIFVMAFKLSTDHSYSSTENSISISD